MIEPLHELMRAVGKVRYNLAFHAPTIHTPIGRDEAKSTAARDALMASSAELIVTLHAVPGYGVLSIICSVLERCRLGRSRLPRAQNIEHAAKLLRGLSTYVHDTGDNANDDINAINAHVAHIEEKLHLKPLN